MTKYILNSGGLRNQPVKAGQFFNEIVKDLGDCPKILVCLFADMREDWEVKFEEKKVGFLEAMADNIKPIFELAFPDKFDQQVKGNDAIVIYGGDDHLVQYWLKKFDLPNLWRDKVVATSSAGSDALAQHFWVCDWRQCLDGLGILPIKLIPHYKSDYGNNDPRGTIDWDKAYNEIAEYKDKTLPVYALEEGEFIVIEVK